MDQFRFIFLHYFAKNIKSGSVIHFCVDDESFPDAKYDRMEKILINPAECT